MTGNQKNRTISSNKFRTATCLLLLLSGTTFASAQAQSYGDVFSYYGENEPNSAQAQILGCVSRVESAIDRNWQEEPDDVFSGKLIVTFNVGEDGIVRDLKLKNSSGKSKWDQKALAAVRSAQPFGKSKFKGRSSLPFEICFESRPISSYEYHESLPERVSRLVYTASYEIGNKLATLTNRDAQTKQKDVDFGPYTANMQRKIRSKFVPLSVPDSLRTTVQFKLKNNGTVQSLNILKQSANQSFNDHAVKAIIASAPFGLMPDGAPPEVDFQYTFDLLGDPTLTSVFTSSVFPKSN